MDKLIAFGSEIKMLSDTHFGGYLVRFGNPEDADLQGDYFTKDTDFDIDWDDDGARKSTVYFHHGLDRTIRLNKLGNGRKAEIGMDDVGVWIDFWLDTRSKYDQMVQKLARSQKSFHNSYPGWSAGTQNSLVQKTEVKPGVYHIDKWPLGLDASITPIPVDWKNQATIKSLSELSTEAEPTASVKTDTVKTQPDGDVDGGSSNVKISEETIMSKQPNTPVAPQDVPQNEPVSREEFESLKGLIGGLDTKLDLFKPQPSTDPTPVNVGNTVIVDEKKSSDINAPIDVKENAYKAFNLHIRRQINDAEYFKAMKAAMEVGTDSEGGYIVPETWEAQLITPLTEMSILRSAGARVMRMSGTKKVFVPSLTHSSAAVLTAEEGAYDQQEPTYGQIEFEPYKYTRISKVSEELLEDSMFDVAGAILAPDAAQAFASAENTAFTTGTGSSQPQGVVTGASAGVTAASTTAITADEIIDLYHSLGYLYRDRAVWMMNDATLQVIRKLKDGDSQYLWQPGLQAGQPDRILGRPVITNNTMATGGASNVTVLFGDMSYYWIMDFGVSGYQRLDELYAANGQVGFRWWRRFDGNVMLSAAIKKLTQAAS